MKKNAKKSCFIVLLIFNICLSTRAQTAKVTVDGKTFTDWNKDGKLEPYEDTRLPNNARIADLMSRLSVEEKISLVIGSGGFNLSNAMIGYSDVLIPGSAGMTSTLSKYGIPGIVMTDGPAGVRISPTRKNDPNTYYGTGYPVGTALACSWDVDLVEKIGNTLGKEAKEYGSDVHLTPGMNIMRNPLNGRNFEYYSEDPLVSGKIAAALVRGMQQTGVAASPKHYAANNNETNRMSIDVCVSQRALREIYLKGFEIMVKESNPATIMSTYNKLNGVYTSANYDLLTTVLRDEWGFKGLVMTDWFGGYTYEDVTAQKLNKNIAAMQIKAGNDLIMPGLDPQKENIRQALASGTLKTEELDLAVKNVLNLVFSSVKMSEYPYTGKPDLKANAQITRQAATDGMVLLKNEQGTLPLVPNIKKLAVFGTVSYNFIAGGMGSGFVQKAYVVSLITGLNNAGYMIDQNVQKLYDNYSKKDIAEIIKKLSVNSPAPEPTIPELKVSRSVIEKSAQTEDIAVVTIGRISGEMGDRKVNDDFNLTADEQTLLTNVSDAFHKRGKKVVVVLNIGGVIETASWKNKADAVLLAWQPGQEGGNSVADVLTGKVDPSGKLTMTFPIKYEDVPSAKDFPGTPANYPTKALYNEGIYVGYRYYNTFNIKPSYEFGYGLSYTTFEYTNLKLSSNEFNRELFVTVDIKNTGAKTGKEVVQLYLSAPKGGEDKPVKELKAFAKTKLLQPGEMQTLTFRLTSDDLASFNPAASAWIADKGIYKIEFGASALDVKQSITFDLASNVIVEKVNNVLNNTDNFIDLKP